MATVKFSDVEYVPLVELRLGLGVSRASDKVDNEVGGLGEWWTHVCEVHRFVTRILSGVYDEIILLFSMNLHT
jgi:hypothetical protein